MKQPTIAIFTPAKYRCMLFMLCHVQVAVGMDSMLVLACCCAVDEEFDEVHHERNKRETSEMTEPKHIQDVYR